MRIGTYTGRVQLCINLRWTDWMSLQEAREVQKKVSPRPHMHRELVASVGPRITEGSAINTPSSTKRS